MVDSRRNQGLHLNHRHVTTPAASPSPTAVSAAIASIAFASPSIAFAITAVSGAPSYAGTAAISFCTS